MQTILLTATAALTAPKLHLFDTAGNATGDAAGYVLTEFATGAYKTSVPDSLVGNWILAHVKDGATLVDVDFVRLTGVTGSTALVGRDTAAEIATAVENSLSGGVVDVISAVSADGGTIEIVAGDDHLAANSRALIWTSKSADQWGNLVDAEVLFGAKYGVATLQKAGSVLVATGTQKVQVELTSAETGALPVGDAYRFDVQLKYATGSYATIIRGKLRVLRSYSNPPA